MTAKVGPMFYIDCECDPDECDDFQQYAEEGAARQAYKERRCTDKILYTFDEVQNSFRTLELG